jgi:phage replication-related protein YjqB (UPF0714/DUF867 family)
MRPLSSYAELQRHALEGRDYRVELHRGSSTVAVMAPHGGRIEPGSDILAAAIAGNLHSYYAFKGLRAHANCRLHLPSHLFDEPRALNLAFQCRTILTIHGCGEAASRIYLGGRNSKLKDRIADGLTEAGCEICLTSPNGLKGMHPNNLCNRGRCNQGVQMELSCGLRQALLPVAGRDSWAKTGRINLQCFIDAVRLALTSLE